MELLPIVYKTDSNSRIRLIEITPIKVRPVDSPAFVESRNKGSILSFIYPGSQEETLHFNISGLSVTIGKISGRFYQLSGLCSPINDNLKNEIIERTTSVNTSLRFTSNIVIFISLVNFIKTIPPK